MEKWHLYSRGVAAGGGSVVTSAGGGGATYFFGDAGAVDFSETLPDYQSFIINNGSHNHGGAAGSHNHGNPDNSNYAPPISSDGSHFHFLHDFYLVVPDHTHDVDIPIHTHDLEFGIFLGPKPTAVTVEVDGNVVPGLGTSESGVDLIPYLATDDEGRILRGQFHEVKITPNNLGRITANVMVQCFINSRGGGNH